MRARLAVLLSFATLAGLYVVWPTHQRERMPTTVPRTASPVETAAPERVPLRPPPTARTPNPVETSPAAPLVERAAAVRDACGLPIETRCEGASCVVFAQTPAMDGLAGWLQLSWSSPAFVGSVLARDAGVRALPCPDAIAGLELDAIRMLPTTEGEIWCAGSGPDHRALCEQATGVSGFTGETRQLRF